MEDLDLNHYYIVLWDSAAITEEPELILNLDETCTKILNTIQKYQAVEDKTNVPWQLASAIHMRESRKLSFNECLHNGDPLNQITTHVPQGRGPFPSWEASAIDAFTLKGFDKIPFWDIPTMLEAAEKYNGLGYLLYHHNVHSPYLWSYTDQYTSGKYAKDSSFDPNLIDSQPGVAALFLMLKDRGYMQEYE